MFFTPPPKKKNPIGTKILDTSLLPNYDYYTLNNGQISYLQPLPLRAVRYYVSISGILIGPFNYAKQNANLKILSNDFEEN